MGLEKGYGLTKPWCGCSVRRAISCQAANSIRRLGLLSANWARSISAPPPLPPTSAPPPHCNPTTLLAPPLASTPAPTPLCFSPRICPSALLAVKKPNLTIAISNQARLYACSHIQLCSYLRSGIVCLIGPLLPSLWLDLYKYYAICTVAHIHCFSSNSTIYKALTDLVAFQALS